MLVSGFASVPVAAAAASTDIVINEVVTNSDPIGDWVELANPTDNDIDISGWTAIDSGKSSKPITFPKNTVIPARGYYAFYTDGTGVTPDGSKGFGLGGDDQITIKDEKGNQIDEKKWSSHGMRDGVHTSRGLVPDMTGKWQITDGPTRESANAKSDFDKVFINEITTDGVDFIELVNNGDKAVNIGGWVVVDSGDGKGNTYITFAPNTIIPAGGYYVLTPDGKEGGVVPDGTDGFGLSAKDSLTLKTAAGELVDEFGWTESPVCEGAATSWSRYSEANNDFKMSSAKSKGDANAAPCGVEDEEPNPSEVPSSTSQKPSNTGKIRINEIQTKGDFVADWVELYNAGDTPVDISGWKFADDKQGRTPIVFPKNTVIQPGGYYSFYTEVDTPDGSKGFGLGEADSARLYRPDDNKPFDEVSWTSHTRFSWGRTPDGEGDLVALAKVTKDGKNAEELVWPEGEPWPDEVNSINTVGGFAGENFSGVDFDGNGNAWIVNNNPGRLFELEYDEDKKTYSKKNEWTLTYENGAGNPDAEGVTVGKDGKIYIATERDGSGPSRPSILEFDPSRGKVTGEWNLNSITGEVPPNFGLEAIAYLPDLDVYAVGVEYTGFVHFVRLQPNGEFEEVGKYENPELRSVMALDYNANSKELRVLCDEACDGLSVVVSFDGTTAHEVSGVQARPVLMENFANEGYGTYEKIGECTVDGQRTVVTRFLWSDDAPNDPNNGLALRAAEAERTESCTPAEQPTPTVTSGNTTTSAAPTTVTVPAVTETVTPTVTTTDTAVTTTVSTEPTTVTETPTITSTVTTAPTTTAAAVTATQTETAATKTVVPTETTKVTETPVTTVAAVTATQTETAATKTVVPTETTKVTETPVTTVAAVTATQTETAATKTVTPTETTKVTETPTTTAAATVVYTTVSAPEVTVTPTETKKMTTTPTTTAAAVTATQTETAATKTVVPTETTKVTETPVTTVAAVTATQTETAAMKTVVPTETKKVTETPTTTAAAVTATQTETAAMKTVVPTETKKVTETPTTTAAAVTETQTETAATKTVVPTETKKVTETPVTTAAAVTATQTSSAKAETVTPTVTEQVDVTPVATADAVTETVTNTAQTTTVTAAPVTTTVAGRSETETVTPTSTVQSDQDAVDVDAPVTTTRTAPNLTKIVAGETNVYYRVAAANGAIVEVNDLPEGLEFRPEDNVIAGRVAKPGSYTAEVVTTTGNSTIVEKVRFEVEAAPETSTEHPLTTVTQTATAPAESQGSSLDGKCVAALTGWSLPLVALIPLGIASQVDLPLPAGVQDSLHALRDQAQQMLPQVDPQIGMIAGGLAAAALGVLAIVSIVNACGGGEGSSAGSSN
nr:lamin tail domain-containing protein [Corynebacterium sp. ACRPZ]